MTDELDVLRHDHDAVEPDPRFRAELMDRLRDAMASGSDVGPGPVALTRVAPAPTTDEQPPLEVVSGDSAARRPRRPGRRWLVAVAAVVALFVLAAAMTLLDDGQRVDTVPPVTEAPQPGPQPEPQPQARPLPHPSVQTLPGRTIVSGSGCPFGISGDPVDLQVGPASGRFDVEGGQGVAHLLLGSQTAEIHVPGFELTDETAWHFEPVELGDRSAKVWLDGPESSSRTGQDLPFVQVRYLPDSDEPCGSFTVTVDGGTTDANRATAVDLAARVLLPSDLQDLDLPGVEGGSIAGLELPGTTWAIRSVGRDIRGAFITFADTTVSWNDGCATVTAHYELDRENGYLLLSDRTSTDPGCTPPTAPPDHPELSPGWDTIASVMGSERIGVGLVENVLYLGERFTDRYLELSTPG